MDLTDADLRDLAAFFARRMTTEFVPVDPMDAPLPRVHPVDAWVAVLTEARDEGWLPSLGARVRATDPDDELLQETCRLLKPPRSHRESLLAGALFVGTAVAMMAMVVGGMAVTGVLLALEAGQAEEPVLASLEAMPAASPDPGEVVGGLPDPGDTRPGAVAPPPAAASDGEAHVVDVPRVEDGPSEVPLEPGVGSSSPDRRRFKCHGRPGEAVGYFYAGRHSPGVPGASFEMKRNVNVRVSYPSEANGWDKGSLIRCVLTPGDRVTLSARPIALPGGHYWVPVFPGDVEDGHADEEVASL